MPDAADRIIDLYRLGAEAFDKARLKVLFEASWLDRFTGLLPPAGSILDIGCGSGEPIARHLIARGFPVTGIDSAPEMLAMCRARFPAHDWFLADMRSLALARAFDGIIAWDSFFHLQPDAQRGMFPIFAAHAVPGGALMFTSGPAHGIAIGTFQGEPLYHASLDPAEYRALLSANGFEVVHHAAEDPDCGGHTVWLARRVG
jgi:SAM-dependent methyltransferase